VHGVAGQHEPCSVDIKVFIVPTQAEEVRLCKVLLPHVVGVSVRSRGGWEAGEFSLKQMARSFRRELTNEGDHVKLKACQCNVCEDVIKVVPVASSCAALPDNVCITASWRLTARTVTATHSSCATQLQKC
jgi:membrane protein YqaA with SNARE-associated domain